MTNTIIRRIILLGAFSILSLLAVQTYWVLRTWNLSEQEFTRKVNQALLDAANDLHRHYDFDLPNANLINQIYSNYYIININNVFNRDPGITPKGSDEIGYEISASNPSKYDVLGRVFRVGLRFKM